MIAKAMPYGTMDLPMMPMVMLSVLLILAAASLLLPVPPPDSKAPVFQGLRESVSMKNLAKRYDYRRLNTIGGCSSVCGGKTRMARCSLRIVWSERLSFTDGCTPYLGKF